MFLMIGSILDILPSALGVALSPLPIVTLILTLMGSKAKANGIAFLTGWALALIALGVIGLNIINLDGNGGKHNRIILWIQAAAGLLMLILAAKNWMDRPHTNRPPKTPKWMESLSRMPWYTAFGLGVVLIVLNPKNLALAIDGVTSIAQDVIGGSNQYVILAIYVIAASLSLIVPIFFYFTAGDTAKKLLFKLKGWLIRHNSVIMATVLLLVGLKMTIEAITKLSA